MFVGVDTILTLLGGLAQTMAEPEVVEEMSATRMVQAGIFLLVGGMGLFIVISLIKRGVGGNKDFDREAAAFELRTLQEFGSYTPGAGLSSHSPVQETVSTSSFSAGPVSMETMTATATALAPAPVSLEETLPPLAYSVVSRLKAGKLLTACEGPARTSRADLTATILSLRNGKKIVVIETPLETGDAAVEAILRFYDGVVVPGPGPDPVFVRRFDSLIADMISI